MAVNIKIMVVWDVTLCSLVDWFSLRFILRRCQYLRIYSIQLQEDW
jgi:hypothetical protein